MNKESKFRVIALLLVALAPVATLAQTNTGTMPGAAATSSSVENLDINQQKERDFVQFNPHYRVEKATRIARARELGKQVIMREARGQNMRFSHQILSELIWLLSASADFKRIDQRLGDLQASLDYPEREATAEEPDAENRVPGNSYTEWFFNPKYKSRFFDRINSPEKLTAYFERVSISDIARTGVDNEREFNEALSYLMQTLLRGKPEGYPYHPQLKATLMDLILHRLRNPATGFWGERYTHNSWLDWVDNLSITFHVVSYL